MLAGAKEFSNAKGGAIDSDAQIERLHAVLTAHFTELRAERGDAPVYLLENGLDATELNALSAAVRSSLTLHRIEGHWWTPHPLPLLVAATEIGYAYRGTGTDFWPIFAEQLELDFFNNVENPSLEAGLPAGPDYDAAA